VAYMQRDHWGTKFVGGLVAVAGGYARATWQKAKPGSLWPPLTGIAVGLGSLGLSRYAGSDYGQEVLEALGYGQLDGAGTWVAANTETLGRVGPGPIPLRLIRSTGTGSAAPARVGRVYTPPAQTTQEWVRMPQGRVPQSTLSALGGI